MNKFKNIILLLILLYPLEGHVSGAYHSEFLNQNFRLTSQDMMRKMFSSPEQAESYFKNRASMVTGSYDASLVFIDDVFSRLKSKSISIAPYNPFSDAINLRNIADIQKIDESAYPLNINLSFGEINSTSTKVEVTLNKPMPEKELKWFYVNFLKALNKGYKKFEQGKSATKVVYEKPAISKFNNNFALYFGTNALVPPTLLKSLEKQLKDKLDKTFSMLESRFSEEASTIQLGDTGRLQSVEKVGQKIGYKTVAESFSPYGPMLSGDEQTGRLIQFSRQKGAIQTIVMISPQKAWTTAGVTINGWLDNHLLTTHDKRFKKEQAYFLVDIKHDLEKIYYLAEIENKQDPRFLKALEKWALLPYEPGKVEDIKSEALEILSGIDSKIRLSVALKVLKKSMQDDYTIQQKAVDSLSNYPESNEALNSLLKIWRNKSLEWNLRYYARDTLIEMSQKLSKDHPLFEKINKLE